MYIFEGFFSFEVGLIGKMTMASTVLWAGILDCVTPAQHHCSELHPLPKTRPSEANSAFFERKKKGGGDLCR